MKRDSFIFYASFWDAIKELPRDVQGEVLTAVIEYGLYGETTEQLKPVARAIVTLIKPQIDANNKRYENGVMGAEHGKKGGNPNFKKGKPNPYYSGSNEDKDNPKDNPKITPKKPQDNPKITPNVNDNVNVNVNENENDNVNVISSFSKKEAKTREQKKEPPIENSSEGLNAFGEERKKVAPKKESAVTEECPPKLSEPIEIIEFDGEGNQVYPSTEKTPKKARFCKPTVEEIRGYCWERGNNVDAQKFFDYYESNGWKVGRNAMKDWKAAVRTWERNGFDNNNTQTQKANGSTNTNATNDNQPRYGRMSEETAIRSATGWA